MNRSFPWAFAAGCGVAVLAGILAVRMWQSRREWAMDNDHAVQVEVRDAAWTRERYEREQRLVEEARLQEARFQAEFLAAAGGGLAAQLANPSVTLTRALELISQACLPAHATVAVTVDRFVEFEVLATLRVPPQPGELASWSRCVLASSGNLIHSLRFAYQGEIQGMMDRRAIESVTDWDTVTDGDLAKLLAGDPDRESPSTSSRAESQDPPEDEDPDSDAARMRVFRKEFGQWMKQKVKALEITLQELLRTPRLEGLETVQDSQRRKNQSRELQQKLLDLKSSLLGFADVFESMQATTQLDPVFRRATLRGVRQSAEKADRALDILYRRIADFSSELDVYFATLERHWGHWQVESDGVTARFVDAAARVAFVSADRSLANSVEGVHQAYGAWIESFRF